MPVELTLDFEVVTPLFLGGAEQAAELRPPALKGLLRFWYRAADPNFMNREEHFFGGTSGKAGQCRFLLRVESDAPRIVKWSDLGVGKFSQGSGHNKRNGLIYLGFPFQMGGNEERTAVAPGHAFRVRCLLTGGRSDAGTPDEMRRLLAAWWLLAHMGGAGSRSRRGFGAIVLKGWRIEDRKREKEWHDLAGLPLLAAAASPADGRAALDKGLATIRGWFGSWEKRSPEHPHLGPAFRFKLLDNAYARSDWAKALAEMGAGMQDFRLRRGPDYQMVKDHIQAVGREGGRFMQTTPPRATFGLPLAFRYSSTRGQAMLVPYNSGAHTTYERHGSLLLLRPVTVGDRLHPLYVRMDGAVPGMNPPAALRKQTRGLLPATEIAMDSYFDSLTSGRRA